MSMKSEGFSDTAKLFGCLGIIAAIPIVTIGRGWALSIMWGWFMVPIFHLPPIGIVQAIALSMVASLYAGTHDSRSQSNSDDEPKGLAYFVGLLLQPFVIVGCGWLLKLFL